MGWVCATAVMLACVEDPPEPDFELRTKWFLLRGFDRSETELCGGTIAWLDGYTDSLAHQLGLDEAPVATYDWYSHNAWTELRPCPRGAGGCFWPDTIHATDVPFEHEIVHAVLEQTYGNCVYFLGEGLAELFGGPRTTEQPAADIDVTVAEMIALSFSTTARPTTSLYQRSRHFVSFLRFEYGLDRVLELCAATPRGGTIAALEDAFVDVLGTPLPEVLAAYADYPVCDGIADRAKLYECGRDPEVVLGPGDQHVFELDLSCAHPSAVGPRKGRFHVSTQLRLLEDGVYSWSFDSSSDEVAFVDLTGARLSLEQCASCGEGAFGRVDVWTPEFIALPEWLPAGDYTLEIMLPLEFSGRVNLTFVGTP